MMKNLFYAAAVAALACTGCAKEEAPAGPEDLAVKFSTEISSVTRTAPTTATNFGEGESFCVKATQVLGDAAASTWMDNITLTKTGGNWTAGDSYYFMKGYKYNFCAYAPTKAALTMTDTEAVPYTVSKTLDDQNDLLYATASKDFTADGETANVALTFDHALSQVKFSAMTAKDYSAYYTVTVKNIAIKQINSQGTFKFSDGSWTLADTSVTPPLDYSIDADQVLTETDTDIAATGGHVLMLLPQDPSGKTLTVTFDVAAVDGKGDASLTGTGKTIDIEIPASSTAWEKGFAYTYQIKLNLDATLGWTAPAISDPTITEWKDGGKFPVGN